MGTTGQSGASFTGRVVRAIASVLTGMVTASLAGLAYVALVFLGFHFVERNFVTPMVEDRSVSLPPVISIFSTLLGPATMVAVPVTIVAITAIETLFAELPSRNPRPSSAPCHRRSAPPPAWERPTMV